MTVRCRAAADQRYDRINDGLISPASPAHNAERFAFFHVERHTHPRFNHAVLRVEMGGPDFK